MATVALQMIVKDEFVPVEAIIDDAYDYFDQINLTVSDKTTANKLKKTYPQEKFNIVWREWNGRFDEARNENLKLCSTDFFFWMDADDTFDFGAIAELVDIADRNDIDAIFLPYNYAQDEQGNCITRHYRERLIRNDVGYESRGWVHETWISDQNIRTHRIDSPEVVHHTSHEKTLESIERNHDILVKAYAETDDPRYLHYLGMSYFSHKEYEKSAELLSKYLEVGGSVEDSYRALSVISECAYHLGQEDMALEYASKTIVLKPEYPMGYWLMAQYEADQENWQEALEWVKTSLTKPDPDTLSVYDPSARERAILIGAEAEFKLGNYNRALAYLRKIPNNKDAIELMDHFVNEADAETFVKLLPKMVKFFHNKESLYEALCDDMRYDVRLRSLRNAATTPTAWTDKSLVIFCGEGYEEWNPGTLDKGMGGSEEAVVYLAPLLQKLGYNVTVYGEVEKRTTFDGVRWVPWKEIDLRDQFNIFVSWRSPQVLKMVNAKKKVLDLHDVIPENLLDVDNVTFFVKSQFQRDLYPNIPDDRFVIIGNGIHKEQFHDETPEATS
jgi:tetratricopeptide (TPR) repeat protein